MQAVYFLGIKDIAKNEKKILPFLDVKTLKEAEKFKDNDDRFRYLGGAFLVRAFTAKGEMLSGKNGKPFKKELPFFNLSHSGEYVGLFVCDDGEVGLDVQQIKEINPKLFGYMFKKDDISVNTDEDFCKFWSIKEAALKCVGKSVACAGKVKFSILSDSELILDGQRLFYKSFAVNGYKIAACSFKKIICEVLFVDCEFVLKMLAINSCDRV